MKKIFLLISLFAIIACGPNAKEKAEERKRDSILTILKKKMNDSLDSVFVIKQTKTRIDDSIANLQKIAEEKRWSNTPAGKIRKIHPEWTKEDCERIANRRIWIGMNIHMVSYMRGLPNSKNVSNYGDGSEYQYCWHNYTPSCFYTKEDQIVYSYN